MNNEFNGWNIIKNDFIEYAIQHNYTELLCEDMFQAQYENYTIDAGCYSTENENIFITYLIKEYNWEDPILKFYDKNIKGVYQSLKKIKSYLDLKII